MLDDVPFCGPQTSWKSSPGLQENSFGAFSPSMVKETVNCSSAATTAGAFTRTVCADARAHTSARAIAVIHCFILPILVFLTAL